MEITVGAIKALRSETGAGIMDCKRALAQSDGDHEKALQFLSEKGIAAAAKKPPGPPTRASSRPTSTAADVSGPW